MKFRTSFVITGRKVRELHPVSRHVRLSGQSHSTTDCLARLVGVVVGSFRLSKYPVTLSRVRVRSARGGSFRDALRAGLERLSLTPIPPCPCADCVPVLREEQPARSALTCPPAENLMVHVVHTGAGGRSLSSSTRKFRKNFSP